MLLLDLSNKLPLFDALVVVVVESKLPFPLMFLILVGDSSWLDPRCIVLDFGRSFLVIVLAQIATFF